VEYAVNACYLAAGPVEIKIRIESVDEPDQGVDLNNDGVHISQQNICATLCHNVSARSKPGAVVARGSELADVF